MLKIKKSDIPNSFINCLIDLTALSDQVDFGQATSVVLMPDNYEVEKDGEKFFYSSEVLQKIVENSNSFFDRDLIVDLDHLAFKDDATYEDKKALGWIKAKSFQFIQGLGLVCSIIWNSNIVSDIKNKAFKYISAVISKPNAKTPAVFGAALTNTPAVNFAFEPITALTAAGISIESEKEKDTEMPELKRIAEILELTSDATEDQIITAIIESKKSSLKLTAQLAATLNTEEDNILECVKTLVTDKKKAEDEVIKLTAEKSKLNIEKILDKAQSDGRITKADRPKWQERLEKNLELTSEILNELSQEHLNLVKESGKDTTKTETIETTELTQDGSTGKKVEASNTKLHNKVLELRKLPENKDKDYGQLMKIADEILQKTE